MFLTLVFIFLGSFAFSDDVKNDMNPSGSVLVEAKEELQKNLFPAMKEPYYVPLDEISKTNGRKRLVYWLNFRESRILPFTIDS